MCNKLVAIKYHISSAQKLIYLCELISVLSFARSLIMSELSEERLSLYPKCHTPCKTLVAPLIGDTHDY
jgi:hypothetical protein